MDGERLEVNDAIAIPLDEIRFTYSRSSGPGGQNVNKVSTHARLRWSPAESPSLPDDVRERFLRKYHRRLSATGELTLTSDQHRHQRRNAAECLRRLREMLLAVARPPRKRRKTRPTRGSQERRLEHKRQTSERKRRRQPPNLDR
ncbi:MAG: aminoacyl-tRNA hydrolase [Planctomycetes bacterium]|nr:aminoacyl-tRNA hydrolase [Planctomycetota bacterium]